MADDLPSMVWEATKAPVAPPKPDAPPVVDPLDSKRAAAETNLKDVTAKEGRELEGALGRFEKFSDDYTAKMRQAISAEGAMQRDLQPFDTQKELSKHQTSLWEAPKRPPNIRRRRRGGSSVPARSCAFARMRAGACRSRNWRWSYRRH